jgi:hypothetical protein
MARSSCAGVSLNPLAAGHCTITGMPSARRTMSMYETHAGTGTTTSSPASTVACSAL